MLRWSSFDRVLSDYIYLEYLQKDLTTFHQIYLSLDVRVRVKLSNVSPYSVYQSLLLNEIKSKRELGWYYHQISKTLTERGFMSVRGKPLSPKHLERMEKKFLIKETNETMIDKSIVRMKVEFE